MLCNVCRDAEARDPTFPPCMLSLNYYKTSQPRLRRSIARSTQPSFIGKQTNDKYNQFAFICRGWGATRKTSTTTPHTLVRDNVNWKQAKQRNFVSKRAGILSARKSNNVVSDEVIILFSIRFRLLLTSALRDETFAILFFNLNDKQVMLGWGTLRYLSWGNEYNLGRDEWRVIWMKVVGWL